MQKPYFKYFENMICSLVSAIAEAETATPAASKTSRVKFENMGVMDALVGRLKAAIGRFVPGPAALQLGLAEAAKHLRGKPPTA